MSHNHGGMSMGSMGSMALPALTEFPKFYYAVVGSAVGVATLVNIYNYVLYRQRMSAARAGILSPSKPKFWFPLWNATLFAVTREASNFSIQIPLQGRFLRLPTIGRTSLVMANLVVLLVLCFYGLNLTNQFQKENVGFRCGVVTIGQLPLIFMLSGRNNVIGCLTGVSYERLNWLHRWCARCMLLTATIHMGYFFSAWAPYDYIGVQLKQNTLVWKGLAAWCTLVWINFSSATPIRGWNYELFVVQHVVSFALLIGFVYIHAPPELQGYVWAAVAFFFFDRVFRVLRIIYANVSLFHSNKSGGLLACKAEFTPLPHDTTRITITNPPISWSPGQHVFLSCQGIAPLQNHPFTIASIPEDGKMEFLVKAQSGGTRRFFKHAQKSQGLADTLSRPKTVTIEGPYGCHRPLRQFDSVVLLAGSTGATFTVPLLRDILQGWRENASGTANTSLLSSSKGAVTRHVRFVWVVKSRGQLEMFSTRLSSVYAEFQTLQQQARDIKLEMTVYVTCDESFTEEHKSLLSTITAPKNTPTPQTKQSEYGIVELRTRTTVEEDSYKAIKDEIKELTITTSSSSTKDPAAYGQDNTNTCCCRAPIDESSSSTPKQCCCAPSTPCTSTSSSPKPGLLFHPSIQLFSGRPQTKDIIRRSLEQAHGESAVVVCGPRGLVCDVRSGVVSLSDERAVHKGTGAQGVYLHVEGFGW